MPFRPLEDVKRSQKGLGHLKNSTFSVGNALGWLGSRRTHRWETGNHPPYEKAPIVLIALRRNHADTAVRAPFLARNQIAIDCNSDSDKTAEVREKNVGVGVRKTDCPL